MGRNYNNAILSKLKSKKTINYSRKYRCHHASVTVELGKREIRLFSAVWVKTTNEEFYSWQFDDMYNGVHKLTVRKN